MRNKRVSKNIEELKKVLRRGRGRWFIVGAAALIAGGILLVFLAPIGAPSASSDEGPVPEVTYSRDVAPILQENCQECHRPNRIGPFSLMTYEDAKGRAPLLKEYTALRIMPPWHAAEGYGEFKNERRLTQEEIVTISSWVDEGAPEGNPADLPQPRQFPEGWQLGTPDIVLDPGAEFRVRKSKRDFFWSFVLPFEPKEDVWVSAIEVIPGDSEVVHHLGIYVDPTGESVKFDKSHPGLGYPGDMSFSSYIILDFWTPGGTPQTLEPGTAWKIPADSHLVMDIHYTPDGQLHYYEVTASRKIPQDIHLVSGWAHMHYLGKEMKVSATLPDNRTAPVLWVPEYDFHWQQVYEFKEPLGLPRDTRINLVAYYDNSASNPENPYRKPRTISFGQKAKNEMCFFYFHYTVDEEHLMQDKQVDFDGIELRMGSGG